MSQKTDLKDLDPAKTTICIVPTDNGQVKLGIIVGHESHKFIYDVLNKFEVQVLAISKSAEEKVFYQKAIADLRKKIECKLQERDLFKFPNKGLY